MKELSELANLSTLNVQGTEISDAGLISVYGHLPNLTTLNVPGQITDVGLHGVSELKLLTTLGLQGTKITDVGMKKLSAIKNLASLDLRGTNVTDI